MNPKSKFAAVSRVLAVVFLFYVALVSVFVFVFPLSHPPKEEKVLKNFYAHRATFERLRDMLLEDRQLIRVTDWGVETTKSVGTSKPPVGDFPLNRYNEYLALLKETGGVGAFGGREEPRQSVGILVYVSGFGGDTRHVEVCWLARGPANKVPSLDAFYKTPKPRTPVYRHIDGNWYLWADW